MAEIGSPWCAPRCKGKYWFVIPPFITHDSWLFNNASIQETKFLPKLNFLNATYDLVNQTLS